MALFTRYRKWGWDLAKSIFNTSANGDTTPIEGLGTHGLGFDGYQHQALLSETYKVNILHFSSYIFGFPFLNYFVFLKMQYLYLLFCEDDVFPLDKWIFNANGHPLPIKGTLASF